MADNINERHLAKELRESKAFFDKVEKSPLTDEQARAVVCFDNRVLLVASAGSGKTSTMVAKAGYALAKGYFTADRMLLLAFNNDAAAELRERIKERLAPLGLPADKIVAKTFHAFGLDVIGLASFGRPGKTRLKREKCIDFEDMLGLAADCIEQGRWTSPYELIMVDEFQDVSQARARLVSSLLREPGKCLFAVGDDWQSINRFAGSDLAVMTDFEAKFGSTITLKLENTYRCPQSLCDISSQFVQKIPKQIRKSVRSSQAIHCQPDSDHPGRG